MAKKVNETKKEFNKFYNDSPEGTMSIIAAIVVLISAMISPVFSAGLAVGLLVLYGIYKFANKR